MQSACVHYRVYDDEAGTQEQSSSANTKKDFIVFRCVQ